MCLSLLS
jgi:hypothetical protein